MSTGRLAFYLTSLRRSYFNSIRRGGCVTRPAVHLTSYAGVYFKSIIFCTAVYLADSNLYR